MRRHYAAVILYREDEVLIVRYKEVSRHPIGTFTIPAGEFERCDTNMRDTAVREVEEETGLKINRERIVRLGKYNFTMQRRVGEEDLIVTLYACNRFLGDLRGGSETEPCWVKIDDYIAGMYPTPRMSGNFVEDINWFLTQVKRP